MWIRICTLHKRVFSIMNLCAPDYFVFYVLTTRTEPDSNRNAALPVHLLESTYSSTTFMKSMLITILPHAADQLRTASFLQASLNSGGIFLIPYTKHLRITNNGKRIIHNLKIPNNRVETRSIVLHASLLSCRLHGKIIQCQYQTLPSDYAHPASSASQKAAC